MLTIVAIVAAITALGAALEAWIRRRIDRALVAHQSQIAEATRKNLETADARYRAEADAALGELARTEAARPTDTAGRLEALRRGLR